MVTTMNNALFSSAKVEWETPQEFFDRLDDEFHFTLDPCSTHDNAKCQKHYTLDDPVRIVVQYWTLDGKLIGEEIE